MKKVYLLPQTLQEKFSSLRLKQKISLIVTIFVLLAIPITLAALKYQQIFRSKAAGQFGRIVVYDPDTVTENAGVADTNSPDGQGFSKTVNSSLVTIHIYFPDWNQQAQKPQKNQLASFIKKVSAQTAGGCADSGGDRHLSDGSVMKCTDYDGTGTITQKSGESFQYDTRCERERFLNNYFWSSCQSGGGSSGGSDNPPPLSNTGNTEGACADSSGKRHFSDGTVGVCTNYDGTGSITQKEGENFQYDTRCESSRFLDNYWWNKCPKGTSTSYPNNNPNTPSKPTLKSRCNVSDTSTCGPVSGEGGKQLYCRQFDDDPDGGIWVEKQDTLGRCARGEVRKAVQACNPRVYVCQDGQWVVDTFQLVGPGGVAAVGACCSTNSDCSSTEVCDFNRPDNRSCGYRGTCQRGSGSQPAPQPTATQPQTGSIPLGGNCQQTQECATGVCANSWDFATSGKCIVVNSKQNGESCKDTLECTSNDQSCVSTDTAGASCQTITQKDRGRATGNASDCKQGLVWQQGVQDSGGNVYDMCLLNAKVPAGQYCIHNRECQSNSCSNNVCIGGNATPKFTRYLLIKNENGDFNDPDKRVEFTFSEQESNNFINNIFLIKNYVLSDGVGSKTISVRFCNSDVISSTDPNSCKTLDVTLNYVVLGTNSPLVDTQSDQQAVAMMQQASNAMCGRTQINEGEGTVTIQGNQDNCVIGPKRLVDYSLFDLKTLAYTLSRVQNIHPYFAMCQFFDLNDKDQRGKLMSAVISYGGGMPIMSATWEENGILAAGTRALPCDIFTNVEELKKFALLRNVVNRTYTKEELTQAVENHPFKPLGGLKLVAPAYQAEFDGYLKKLMSVLETEKMVRANISLERMQSLPNVEDQVALVAQSMPFAPANLVKDIINSDERAKAATAWLSTEGGWLLADPLGLQYRECFDLYYTGAPTRQVLDDCIPMVTLNLFALPVTNRASKAVFAGGSRLFNLLRQNGEFIQFTIGSKVRTFREVFSAKGKRELTDNLGDIKIKGIPRPAPQAITFLTKRILSQQEWTQLRNSNPRYQLLPESGFLYSVDYFTLYKIKHPDGSVKDLVVYLDEQMIHYLRNQQIRVTENNGFVYFDTLTKRIRDKIVKEYQDFILATGVEWKDDILWIGKDFHRVFELNRIQNWKGYMYYAYAEGDNRIFNVGFTHASLIHCFTNDMVTLSRCINGVWHEFGHAYQNFTNSPLSGDEMLPIMLEIIRAKTTLGVERSVFEKYEEALSNPQDIYAVAYVKAKKFLTYIIEPYAGPKPATMSELEWLRNFVYTAPDDTLTKVLQDAVWTFGN